MVGVDACWRCGIVFSWVLNPDQRGMCHVLCFGVIPCMEEKLEREIVL